MKYLINKFLILLILQNLIFSELIFMIEIYRHGARGPKYDYWDYK